MILIVSFSLSFFRGTVVLMIFLPVGAVVVLVVVAVGRFCCLFLLFVGVSRGALFYYRCCRTVEANFWFLACYSAIVFCGRGGWADLPRRVFSLLFATSLLCLSNNLGTDHLFNIGLSDLNMLIIELNSFLNFTS